MQLWNILGIFKIYLHNELKTHHIDIQIYYYYYYFNELHLNFFCTPFGI